MNYILVPNEVLSAVVDGKPYVIQAEHPNFNAAITAVKEGRFEDIPLLAKVANALRKFVEGKLEIDEENGVVLFNGNVLHNYAATRLVEMMRDGFNVDPMVKFIENLLQNPSAKAVEELYQFIEYGRMPITPDGCFLAYKRVNGNYTSVFDGKTDNSIGTVVEMDRNLVDDRSNNTCSRGLHFCSVGYLAHYSGYRIIVLKVNPRDVVSIPTDYHNTKGRACRYEVVGELTQEEVNTATGGTSVWKAPVINTYEADVADADRDFDDDDDHDYEEGTSSTASAFMHTRSDNDQGYVDGYRDGRARAAYNPAEFGYSQAYVEGYELGYKDGKGHKPKLIK